MHELNMQRHFAQPFSVSMLIVVAHSLRSLFRVLGPILEPRSPYCNRRNPSANGKTLQYFSVERVAKNSAVAHYVY